MRQSVGPWFRKSKNTWYVCNNGKQVSLKVKGEGNEKAAIRAWHRLMAEDEPPQKPAQTPPRAETASKAVSVQGVIDGFLADADGRVSVGCLRNYRIYLLPFAHRFGERSALSLTTGEAEGYARRSDWSSTYRSNFLACLATAYRWAERQRLIDRTPLQGLRRPPKASRGAKAVVSAEQHETNFQI
jgi:hypothetical protein